MIMSFPTRSAIQKCPDFELARFYALHRLTNSLSPLLSYHTLLHTSHDVLPAVERLAILEQLDDEELLLVRTAALFHDIGFVEQRDDHEAISARIAATILPHFGYSNSQVMAISCMIMATKLPQAPKTHLEQLVADADLDVLGRDDFLARNQALRNEFAAYGVQMSDAQWDESQLAFLTSHRYWTSSARRLRDAGKQQNIRALMHRLQMAG